MASPVHAYISRFCVSQPRGGTGSAPFFDTTAHSPTDYTSQRPAQIAPTLDQILPLLVHVCGPLVAIRETLIHS